ncbi:hypothetical protein [Solicola sp. PLA-1-18]|uniref:hypothetical protein n=1 Tax=Solicola sp. PLA-1-18 TaxID=3380532 RepID=UPI003B7A3E81
MLRRTLSGPTSRLMAAGAVLCVLAVSGCSSDDGADAPEPSAPASTSASPSPSAAGVSLTGGGTELALGAPATALLRRGDQDPGVVSVTVTAATAGTTADLADFGVDGAAATSQPVYVKVRAQNLGQVDLAGATVPLTVVDAAGEQWSTTPVVGQFAPCPTAVLPTPFAAGATADLCQLYLLPAGGTVASVQLRSESLAEPITWTVAPAS